MLCNAMKQRRDKSPLTNEELYPFSIRMDELGNLYWNGEISIDEYHIRSGRLYDEFPWLYIESEMPRFNANCFWRDSLGNHGYWIERARMTDNKRKEYEAKGINVYND